MNPTNTPHIESPGTLFICSNVYPPNFIGGAELIAHNQAKVLQKMGWRVVVFTGDTAPQPNRHDISHEIFDGIDVYRIHLVQDDFLGEFVNFAHPIVERHFEKLLDQYQPGIVHFHNIIGLSVRIIGMAKTNGAKTVLTVHDHWGFCYKNTLMKSEGVVCRDFSACKECLPSIEDGSNRHIPMRLRQDYFSLVMRNIDAFISPSAYLAKTYISAGFQQQRFHVVWNGIDTNRFQKLIRNPAPGLLRLSFFGYFGRHKGIKSLLDALPLIRGKTFVRVNLVGEGDQLNEYKSILAANGCADLVRFWGKIDNADVEAAYAETDVLVLPSIWRENQPVSITEAMAAGIPVLASQMGGIPELVEDGVTGLLFDAGNSRQLAASIDRLLAERGLVSRLGENAARRMAKHDYIEQVRKLADIYRLPAYDLAELRTGERLVICVGAQFSPNAFDAVSRISAMPGEAALRFVHAEWCDAWHWKSAFYCLVVDDEANTKDLTELEHSKACLLVPRENLKLASYMHARGNAFSYNSVADLLQLLETPSDDVLSTRVTRISAQIPISSLVN